MINVIIAGIAGRMGQQIAKMVEAHPQLQLAGAFEAVGSQNIGRDAGEFLFGRKNGVEIAEGFASVTDKGDVLIDFTTPAASLEFAKIAAEKKSAMVIGTTGFSEEQQNELLSLAEDNFPCVYAPNMSICVNILFQLVKKTAAILGGNYDIEIVESHHKMKKDAPSGTALKLAEMAAEGAGLDFKKSVVTERSGLIGERKPGEIGIQSLRAADIAGEHSVIFAADGERIELNHRAHSREHFARGAALAAAWVAGKKSGVYSMFDVLDLHNLRPARKNRSVQ